MVFLFFIKMSPNHQLFTDAAPSIGFGGFFQGQWFAEKWPNDFSSLTASSPSSALYELYPIVVASVLWGTVWTHKCIAMFCGNGATAEIINNGRSNCQGIMSLLRHLTWQSVMHKLIITAILISGQSNIIADALSRFRLQVFNVHH